MGEKPPTATRTPDLKDLVKEVYFRSGPNNTRQQMEIEERDTITWSKISSFATLNMYRLASLYLQRGG